MWFKRASKNRRLGREFVLDVKLRSSQVRAKRMRMTAVVLGSVFAAMAGLYLVWQASGWALNVLLYDNKAFAIQRIDVQSDGMIAPDQLRRWTGVRLGQNLFALDLAGVGRNLKLVSMIQSVSLEKVLPHTLRLRVIEREPLAQLNRATPRVGGGFEIVAFYLDPDAYVLLPLSPSQCAAAAPAPAGDQLPVIVGLNANEVQPGRRLESPQVHAALELIQAFDRSSMQGMAEIKKIDISMPEVLLVKTAQGSEITFGLRDLDQQLRRWQAIFDAGLRVNKAIASLDLAVSNNIPASWVETNALAEVLAKSPKPVRPRKKHV
jgi:cell division septal protein FtsQ